MFAPLAYANAPPASPNRASLPEQRVIINCGTVDHRQKKAARKGGHGKMNLRDAAYLRRRKVTRLARARPASANVEGSGTTTTDAEILSKYITLGFWFTLSANKTT